MQTINRIKKFLLGAISCYRAFVRSGILSASGMALPTCRFLPTCSEYATEAIQKKGIVRGVIKTAKRIFRCHPVHPGGWDPVDK